MSTRRISTLGRYTREIAAASALLILLLVVAVFAPEFFTAANWRDLAIQNASTLIVAIGITMVIISGHIDISVGSQFALCSVAAGVLSKAGIPILCLLPLIILIGGALGAINGVLVARFRIPSIVVTLATLVAWRDGLRLMTEGAWVQNLPGGFQWFGFGQSAGRFVIVAASLIIFAIIAWCLRNVAAGRSLYAVGSSPDSARLAGIEPSLVVFGVFVLMGALTGLAALLNAIRFAEIPSNAGAGLELKTIAAAVVGGVAITGGRGRLIGTLIGVLLLGTIGPALTFLGVNPFWEKAIQGSIILGALASDAVLRRSAVGSVISVRRVTA